MRKNKMELGGSDLVPLVREGFPEEVTPELRSCPGY